MTQQHRSDLIDDNKINYFEFVVAVTDPGLELCVEWRIERGDSLIGPISRSD